MGMIGIILIVMGMGHFGFTSAGVGLGLAGAALTALGFRFGFCPACTLACLVSERGTR